MGEVPGFNPEKMTQEEREKLSGEELMKAILDDMEEFLDSGKARPASFWRKSSLESTKIVAEYIAQAEIKDFYELSRMASYFYKVNGEEGYITGQLLDHHNCSFSDQKRQEEYTKSKSVYQTMREKIIAQLLTKNPNPQDLQSFILTYHMIIPDDMAEVTSQEHLFNTLKYGLGYDSVGDIPNKMKSNDVVKYVRRKIQAMCKRQGINRIL